jgi:hypothetical protein
MATVQFRTGDTLNIVIGSEAVHLNGRNLGSGEVVMPFTYEDIMEALASRKVSRGAGKSRRGSTTSRRINLFCGALTKGIWTTGAPINRTEVATKLINLLEGWLGQTEEPLTPKAIKSLTELQGSDLGVSLGLTIKKALDRVK